VVAHSNVVPKSELVWGNLREGMKVREADQGKRSKGSKLREANQGKQNGGSNAGEAECVPPTWCHSEELLARQTFLRNIFVLTGLFDGDLPPSAMVLPAFTARERRKTSP